MFTGIIEATGIVIDIKIEGDNRTFTIESAISKELKIDQSLSHNGVCLTVTDVRNNTHSVTAIKETLERSNLGELKKGNIVNLERAMIINSRLDGHLVQGHVDAACTCVGKQEQNGSWMFSFSYEANEENLLVQKGSVCINGVSLTVVNPTEKSFSVAVIPYTYENTNFKTIEVGDKVNIEFDIIGKYIGRLYKMQNPDT